MKSVLDFLLIVFLLVVLLQSCQKKTNPVYEAGRIARDFHSDFVRGFNAQELLNTTERR